MLLSKTFTNWKKWDIWNSRVQKCRELKVYTYDYDFRGCCARSDNKSNLLVLSENGVSWRRCNIFNCPIGPLNAPIEEPQT